MALMKLGWYTFSRALLSFILILWPKPGSFLGALRTTSGVQTGGRACRCRRPAPRAWTVWRPWTSPPTRLCLETSSTATTTTPKRAPQDRSSGPPSGKPRTLRVKRRRFVLLLGHLELSGGDVRAGLIVSGFSTAPVLIQADRR